jgi:alpha-galactosidase
VDQDKSGKQGKRVAKSGELEIWARPLSGGAQAIGLFNLSAKAEKISVKWADLGMKKGPSHVRDLWTHQEVKTKGAEYSAEVPSHGVVMLRIGK